MDFRIDRTRLTVKSSRPRSKLDIARKAKKSSPSGKVKGRKAAPRADAAWSTRELQRRQVLKGVVVGSGVVASAMTLPKEWTKPVVRSIMASAQAQVSPPQDVPLVPIVPPHF